MCEGLNLNNTLNFFQYKKNLNNTLNFFQYKKNLNNTLK